MPAAEEVTPLYMPERLGLIAGGGCLPQRLIEVCEKRNIELFIVGFEGQTDMSILSGHNHMRTRLGAAGQIIKTLQAHGIYDLVMIGSIRRPGITELKPDMRTAQFFAKIGLKALGDNGLLVALRRELEAEGFVIHGIQKFVDELLIGTGLAGKHKPAKADKQDIRKAIEIATKLGEADVGHSVVIQDGITLAIESAEGTDATIKRAKSYKRKERGGILVKWCKPGQDMDLDLPVIGPQTVLNCAESGLTGIAVRAGHTLMVNAEEVIPLLNKHKIFLIGVNDTHDQAIT